MNVFKFIKAEQFFPVYCPEIKSFSHKMRGKNGRGNPVTFSPDEEKAIKKAISKMMKDITSGKGILV